MRLARIVVAVLMLSVCSWGHSYESGEWTKVKQIYVKNNGSVFVYFGPNSMPGCYGNSSAYLKGSDIDKLYSIILAAYMAEKSLKPLYQYDNKTEGYTGWGLCYVDAVYVKN